MAGPGSAARSARFRRAAEHQGAEIDLLLRLGDRLFGVACKRADASLAQQPAGRAGEDQEAVGVPGAVGEDAQDREQLGSALDLVDDADIFERPQRGHRAS
jgi:hypothetical protein